MAFLMFKQNRRNAYIIQINYLMLQFLIPIGVYKNDESIHFQITF